MKVPLLPVAFEPLFKPKPWGGQRLATLLGKRLPAGEPIGESWELVSLPGNESRVREGPLAGRSLAELVHLWRADLLGDAPLIDGRFPLLVKFLDARENLSVQVHPKPDDRGGPPGLKHEAWYVVHADPGAKLYIGLKPGVGPADVARVANTPAMVDVLRVWAARSGQCYYLPSGTLHALGAGVVVAEIQTPSDITYRAYDWERTGRELHVAEALANIRYDVTEEMIVQPRLGTRLVQCERLTLDLLEKVPDPFFASDTMRVWIVLAGGVRMVGGALPASGGTFARGDVVLIPARCAPLHVTLSDDCQCLEVRAAAERPAP